MVGLGDLPGGNFDSYANDISADGTTVVGWSSSAVGTLHEAFRWTATGGMVGLGGLGNAVVSYANGVSADGTTVVGVAEGKTFIWDPVHGMRRLRTVLTDMGVDMMGWQLTNASAVSADGRTIVGWGNYLHGADQAWVANIAVPEPSSLVLVVSVLGLGAIVRRRGRTGKGVRTNRELEIGDVVD